MQAETGRREPIRGAKKQHKTICQGGTNNTGSGGLRLFEGQGRKNKKGTFWTTWGPTSGHSGFSNLMVFCSPNGALKAALPGRSYPLTLASAALKVPFGALVTSPCST